MRAIIKLLTPWGWSGVFFVFILAFILVAVRVQVAKADTRDDGDDEVIPGASRWLDVANRKTHVFDSHAEMYSALAPVTDFVSLKEKPFMLPAYVSK